MRPDRSALIAVWVLALAGAARAAPIVSVDMDPGTPGVQAVRSVSPASLFEIDVVVQGVASPDVLTGYEFDLMFDTALLTLGEVRDAGFMQIPLFVFDVIPGPTGVHVWAAIRSFGNGGDGDGAILHVELEALAPGDSLVELGGVTLYRPFSGVPGVGPTPLGGVEGGSVTIIPEPATAALLGLGCAAIARARRRATPSRRSA